MYHEEKPFNLGDYHFYRGGDKPGEEVARFSDRDFIMGQLGMVKPALWENLMIRYSRIYQAKGRAQANNRLRACIKNINSVGSLERGR